VAVAQRKFWFQKVAFSFHVKPGRWKVKASTEYLLSVLFKRHLDSVNCVQVFLSSPQAGHKAWLQPTLL
jgi:hypothetical protein